MAETAAATTDLSKAQVREPVPVREPSLRSPEDWHRLVADLGLGGVASQLAHNCELVGWDGQRLSLTLDKECRNLQVPFAEERLKGALAEVLGAGLELDIRSAQPERETPARRQARHHQELRAQAEALMQDDPVARSLREELSARWVAGSIEAKK
jgi:DNA polymerase-3 subunit gamma/tau